MRNAPHPYHVQADDADVDKLRRDPRWAAAAAEAAASSGLVPPPDSQRFFKLPRPRFLALLAAEVARVNAAVTRLARARFESLDAQGAGVVPAGAVQGYLAGVMPPRTPRGNVALQVGQGIRSGLHINPAKHKTVKL